ncbi:tumor necrosis factor receptor superfamily member 14-like isoform X3 [Anabas testudineus]|uniref:tumor necrosis factor receptor superfamily member 14-like isoform X3 n=1 Tax=Anabas testudineus TaxID=64144 RepID=UPI00143CC42F|nr:tumor necrosis factor receptor superfamily member 14-like isoform X3 [Anabas testudineus]
MTFRRKLLTAAYLLILMIKVFSGQTLTCHQAEYQTGNQCCPMCLPGSRVRTDCTEFISTSCLPCVEGTYMNQPTGLKQCFPCSQCDAGSGLKIKSLCTTSSDTLCEPLEGFYCVEPSDNGCGAAQKHKRCEPGQYISQKGTASTDSVCSDCSDGSFSDGTFPSCLPHTQCETKNLQLLKPGTTSTDAECEDHSLQTRKRIGTICGTCFFSMVLVFAFALSCARKNGLQTDDGAQMGNLSSKQE